MEITSSCTNGVWSIIQDKVKHITYMIGLKLKKRKEKRLQHKIDKLCKGFNFNVSKEDGVDKYIIYRGILYRIQLIDVGILITDEQGKCVEDKLLRLNLLVQFKRG
ncbi:hypothetical protein BA746_00305 [Vibrio parahaemolyticus]|nr:hypothetical protein ACX04_15910 [Vibrio parahaemolyticus]OTW07810.1 hypothetical protein BA743_16300 [Vibrio parahaemolyticus]OTW23955.1 hypothetical protein BA744_01075 [Vibrio parahaemolyticus]OTW27235.1 hypothetical protein BA746_00305 [Vibrio parahaemolyticus]